MAKQHRIQPRAMLRGKTETRVLVKGRWLKPERALVVARAIVSQDSSDALADLLARNRGCL